MKKKYWLDDVKSNHNRAGKNLKPERKKILEEAKVELRKLFKSGDKNTSEVC